jgi:hypothetical protein
MMCAGAQGLLLVEGPRGRRCIDVLLVYYYVRVYVCPGQYASSSWLLLGNLVLKPGIQRMRGGQRLLYRSRA